MATTTNILGLTKPSGEDPVDISVLNNNFQLIDNAFKNFVNVIYPVGSIYISTNPTNPATLFQVGTWERVGAGRTLIDCGTGYNAGSTGGAATVTLTAAQSGLKAHTHKYKKTNTPVTGGSHSHQLRPAHAGAMIDYGAGRGNTLVLYSTNSSIKAPSNLYYHQFVDCVYGIQTAGENSKNLKGLYGDTETNSSHSHTLAFTDTDSGSASAAAEAHNNMPPYLAVYMWKRIA